MFEALHFVRIAEGFGEHSLCEAGPWASPPGGRGRRLPTLRIRNVVPAPWLEARWAAAHSATLFSATLAPVEHVEEMLGLPADAAHVDLPSPFAAEQLRVRIAPWISTRYADRLRSLDALVDVIGAQFHERPGNYLAFFSSFEYLDLARQRLAQRHPDLPHWAQTRGMEEPERDAFVARFVERGQGVGFAVLGGAFGEGIEDTGAFQRGQPQVYAVPEEQAIDGFGDDRADAEAAKDLGGGTARTRSEVAARDDDVAGADLARPSGSIGLEHVRQLLCQG